MAGGRATPGGSGGCAIAPSPAELPRPPVWAPPASIPASLPAPGFTLQVPETDQG